MSMYSFPAPNATAPVTATQYDIKNSLFGNSGFTATQHRDVDDRFGWRPGQPSGVKTIRVPQYQFDLVNTYTGGASTKVEYTFDRPLNNVTVVYVTAIHITGLPINMTVSGIPLQNVRVSFEDTNNHHLRLGQRTIKGTVGEGLYNSVMFPVTTNNGVNPSSVLLSYDSPKMITSFKIPQILNGLSLRLYDTDGTPLSYQQISLSLMIESEEWQ